MTNEELANTLRIASKSVNENIALAMLLTMAADRIEEYQAVKKKIANGGGGKYSDVVSDGGMDHR